MRGWLLLLISVAVCGCSSAKDLDAAKGQVAAFHRMLDAEQFAQIYEEGSVYLKRVEPEGKFITFLAAVRRKLGTVKSAELKGWNINYNTSGNFVSLTYQTAFSKGAASENMVFRLGGATPSLAGYHVASDAFLLN